MATVGHVAVGLAAARAYNGGRRPRWPVAAAWSALALLPDADIVGLRLGIRYQAPWGHRGATHSLVFALAAGLVVGLAARSFKRPFARTAAFASLAIGSHGLLDTNSTRPRVAKRRRMSAELYAPRFTPRERLYSISAVLAIRLIGRMQ